MTNKFSDKEGGEKFAEQALKEKYDKKFIVDKEAKEKYTRYPLKNSYAGVFVLEDNTDKKVDVWVSSKGELKDNYAQYYFKQAGEEEVVELIKEGIENINVKVQLVGSETDKKYTNKDSIEKYLDETSSYYDIRIDLLKANNNDYQKEMFSGIEK